MARRRSEDADSAQRAAERGRLKLKVGSRGFTLVEVLAAMVSAAILLGAVARLLLAGYQMWFSAGEAGSGYARAVGALEDLGREIRGASAVIDGSAEQLTLDTAGGVRRYWFADGALWTQDGAEARPLLTKLKTGGFSYWQEKTGESAAPPGGSYSVRISLSWKGGSLKSGFFVRKWS
jgi:prepilin-type N-terminal cleavage/methylation domain-containing protein